MNAPDANGDSFLTLLANLLARVDSGEALDLEQVVADHPAHSAALREYFAADLALCAALCSAAAPTVAAGSSTHVVPTPRLPSHIGDYEILERIARGGMGIVYKARQRSLNRIVALKVVLLGDLAEAESLQRFRAEAELMAQVHHKDIVTIYEVGEAEGKPYLSMELVDGPSLQQVIRDHPLNPRQAAEQMSIVAEAVEFAHSRDILHRDLKPSNILIRASGRPCVGDFGIAKRLRCDSELTFTGQVLGTPSYMSPEQTRGRGDQVGIGSDVYALGAILYELLVGHPPFRAETPMETMRQVQEHEPVSPRHVNPAVPRDLETVCLKCLQKDPARRYGSALAFSQDLQRFLEGRPVMALPVSRWQHAWRWCRRNRMIAGLLAGVATLTVGLLVGLVCYLQVLQALQREISDKNKALHVSLQNADRLRLLAEENARKATEMLFVADLQLAGTAAIDNDPREASAALLRCAELDRDWKLRDFTWRYLKAQVSHRGRPIGDHDEACWHATYSRDGRHLATCGSAGLIRIYNTANFANPREIPAGQGELNCVDFSPDGKLLASAGDDGRVLLWDLATGKSVRAIQVLPDRVFNAKFLPDGTRLATCGRSPEIAVWSVKGERLATLTGEHSDVVEALAVSPDGRWLASAGGDGLGIVWDLSTQKPLFKPLPHSGRLTCVAVTADNRFFFGCLNGSGEVWDLSRNLRCRFSRPDALLAVTLVRDGRVACSDQGGAISLWNINSAEKQAVELEQDGLWQGHDERINALAFSPSAESLVSAARDGTVRLWSVEKQSPVRTLRVPAGGAEQSGCALALTDQPRQFYRCGPWGIESWDVNSPAPDPLFSERAIMACATSGKMLVASDAKGSVGVFSHAKDPAPRWTKVLERGQGEGVGVFPQADRVAVISNDHELLVLGLPDLKVLARKPDCASFAISPDGTWLAVAKHISNDLQILSPNLELIQNCQAHHSTIEDVEISPDGLSVLTVADDRRAIVWSHALTAGAEWVQRYSLAGHPHSLRCAAWSPDGRTLATADERGVVRFWHAGSGRKLLELAVPGSNPLEMRFTGDGLYLLLAGRGFQLRVLDAPNED